MNLKLPTCAALAVFFALGGSAVFMLGRPRSDPGPDPQFHTPRQYSYQRDRETAIDDLKHIQVITETSWDKRFRLATVDVDRGFYLMNDQEKRSALEMLWDYYMTANPDSRRGEADALLIRDGHTGQAIGKFGSVDGLELWER